MSTDARPRWQAVGDGATWPPSDRIRVMSRTVAVISGLVAIVGALILPFAPVEVSTPEVRWPVDPGDPVPTMLMLTAYEPADLELRFSCRAARAAAATPDGVVVSTMSPTSRDAATDALTVRAREGGLTIRSGGDQLWAGPLPVEGDCRFVVTGDATAMRVLLDGTPVSEVRSRLPEPVPPDEMTPAQRDRLPDSEPDVEVITPLPDVDALRTSVPSTPDATPDDLSVRLTLDDAFDHTPSAVKVALIATIVLALAVGAVAMVALALVAAAPRWVDRARGPPRALLAGWLRRRLVPPSGLWALSPLVIDIVVVGVLIAWLFLAPITDDDGYYSAMAANVPFSGYVPNVYQLYNQGFTPFSWPYYALSWWQETFGVGAVPLRIPSLILGIATWFVARAFVSRTNLVDPASAPFPWVATLARLVLGIAYLSWWLPYDMGTRPEPVVAFFTVATLLAVAEGLERRRLALLGLAVGLGTAGLMAAPTGFITLAPLLVATPAAWRLVREGSSSWYAAAGRWVVIVAPGAVGSLLGFSDGAYRDFVRSQDIFAPIQRAATWYEELGRYAGLLSTDSHFGSYARRAAVLACLLALVWFVVLVVAARARSLRVPTRLPLTGWSTLLAFALLLPTPSKPTHHFGAFAGIGAILITLVLVIGPQLLAALDRERRVPQAALVGAGLATVIVSALAWHGRAMWPHGWGLGQPSDGNYPSVRGVALDQPLWWLLGLAAVTAVLAAGAHRVAPQRRRLSLGVAVPVMVTVLLLTITVWTVGDFVRAADRTSTTWSPQVDAWRDPTGERCGLAGQIDVLDTRAGRTLAPAVLPGAPPPPPLVPLDAPDAPSPESRTEAFVPGAVLPDSPPPESLPPDTPVFGSFLVPEVGANADSRTGTFTTDWYRLGPTSPDAGLAVDVSGRLKDDVTLRVEYGRETPDGFVVTAGRSISDDENSVAWRTVPLVDEDAPPPGTDAVRLVAEDSSTTTGGWLAFSAPVERRWVPLQQYLPPDGAVGVAWQIKSLFPCLRQPRQQAGITEPAVAAVGFGVTPGAALGDWTFDPERGGLLGHAQREADVTLLTTRVRDVGDQVDDVHIWEYREPYPADAYELIRNRRTVSGMP